MVWFFLLVWCCLQELYDPAWYDKQPLKDFKKIVCTKLLVLRHHLDTHRHQESAYESQQWWQSKASCCNACWVPVQYKAHPWLPACFAAWINDTTELSTCCHHCWDSYADSWCLCVSNLFRSTKGFVHNMFLKFFSSNLSSHAEPYSHYQHKTNKKISTPCLWRSASEWNQWIRPLDNDSITIFFFGFSCYN